MTSEDLKKLEKLFSEATPGEWQVGSEYEQSNPGTYISSKTTGLIIAAEQDNTDCVLRVEDANLIIAIHNALPDLLKAAEEQNRLIEKYADTMGQEFTDVVRERDELKAQINKLHIQGYQDRDEASATAAALVKERDAARAEVAELKKALALFIDPVSNAKLNGGGR